MAKRQSKPYTDEEKSLVEHLKEKLKQAGVLKFPPDWHLKQLSTARKMLAGGNAPKFSEWIACIDWAFADRYWRDRVDHLARIMALWPKYRLQKGGGGSETSIRGHRNATQRGGYQNSKERYANTGDVPF